MSSNLSFDRLQPGQSLKPFNCDTPDINEFLFEDAFNYSKSLLAVTYIIEDDKNTIAYFSVLNDKISIDEVASNSFWKKQIGKKLHFEKRGLHSYPAVKIGRLGVSMDYKRQKFGVRIIDWVKEKFTINNKTGCLFITVDALNTPDAIGLYTYCGFEFLNQSDENEETRVMFFCLLEEKV